MKKYENVFATFNGPKNKKIRCDFTGKSCSSNGGIIAIKNAPKNSEKKESVLEQVCQYLDNKDTRQKGKVKHRYRTMLMQRVYGMACGYEDLNDFNELRFDKVLQAATDTDEALASPSTLCRFENSITFKACKDIFEIFIKNFVDNTSKLPSKFIIDVDGTVNKVHGKQQKSGPNGYYGCDCYIPLYFFHQKQLLGVLLRGSDVDAAKYTYSPFSRILELLWKKWPKVKPIFRGDSGFWRPTLVKWCEQNNVHYFIAIGKNNNLNAFVKKEEEILKERYAKRNNTQKSYIQFMYKAEKWDYPRRVIAKIEVNSHGSDLRYVVTNFKKYKPKQIYEMYTERGEMENRFKELKNDLSSDRTSCHRFVANQFRLLESALAYTELERFRALYLADTDFKNATCGTIMLTFIKIGTDVEWNTRTIHFAFTESYPHQDLMKNIVNKFNNSG